MTNSICLKHILKWGSSWIPNEVGLILVNIILLSINVNTQNSSAAVDKAWPFLCPKYIFYFGCNQPEIWRIQEKDNLFTGRIKKEVYRLQHSVVAAKVWNLQEQVLNCVDLITDLVCLCISVYGTVVELRINTKSSSGKVPVSVQNIAESTILL